MKYMLKSLCASWLIGFIMVAFQVIADPLVMNNITFIFRTGNGDSYRIFLYIGILLLSTIAVCIGNTVCSILKRYMIFSFNAEKNLNLMSKVLYTDCVFMQKNSPEKIITRISRDVNDYSDFKISTAIELPLIVTGLITTCYMMFCGSPQFLTTWGINLQHGNFTLALIIILMTPLHLTFLLFNNKFIKIEQDQADAHENEIHLATESLNAIEDIRSSFAFSFILERLKYVYKKTQQNKTKLFALFSVFQSISGLTWKITQIIVLGISAWLITKSESDFKFEDYNGFCMLCGMFNQYITKLVDIILNWQRANPAKRRISELCKLNNRFKYCTTAKTLDANLKLKFKNVTYRIANRNILTNINFELNPGQHIALVGPSGSGKSTLLKLAMCHLNPTSGNIQYGEQDLQNINFQDYTSKVAYVSQHPFIFQGSFLENILVGRKINFSEQEIISLMHDVALVPDLIKRVLDTPAKNLSVECSKSDFTLRQYLAKKHRYSHMNDEMAIRIIKNSPLLHSILLAGLSGKVKSTGKNISGGQAAKLALARALIGKPEILLLDEITAALDELSQDKIMQTLTNKYRDCTIIFVSHRIHAIRRMDRIVVLKMGKIVQDGTYNTLAKERGLFAELIEKGHELRSNTNV